MNPGNTTRRMVATTILPWMVQRMADVCVVGGGYTGLSAAIEFARKGYSVALLEGYKIGSGASGRNGGVFGTGQRKDQDGLESWLGMDDARKMWQTACDTNQLVRDRVVEFNIDCDLKDGELTPSHWKFYPHPIYQAPYRSTCTRHVPLLGPCAKLEVPISLVNTLGLPANSNDPTSSGTLGLNQAPVGSATTSTLISESNFTPAKQAPRLLKIRTVLPASIPLC